MHIIICCLLILIFSPWHILVTTAQAQGVQQAWVQRYNGLDNGDDWARAVAVDTQGNVYVTGYSTGSGIYNDYATIKYSPGGQQLWVRRYNGPSNGDDRAYALAVDSQGNVYVTGWSTGSGTYNDYATIKYSPSGAQLWVRRYNGPSNGDDRAYALAVDSQGNVYVTGWSEGSETSSDYATIKYSPAGNEVWVRRYNGPRPGANWANALAVDGQGNVYVTAVSMGSGTYYDYATIKYDTNGNQKWVRRYNGPGNDDDGAVALAVDGQGNVYVTGWSEGSETSSDYATIKYDTNGNRKWVRRYNGPASDLDQATALAVDGQGNVYVTGFSWVSGIDIDYATVKYSPEGDQVWVRRYRGPRIYYICSAALAVDGHGNVYVTGCSVDSGNYYDYATVKYSPSGEQVWASRYGGSGNGNDSPAALAVDAQGNVYVTGYSVGSGTGCDYATVKYRQSSAPCLAFSQIDSPQAVGVEFPVEITAWKASGALDTAFNGEVSLSVGGAPVVSPATVYLSQGKWQGNVKVLEGGANLVLNACGGGRSGQSNAFYVPAVGAGNLSGTVQDNRYPANPIAGAKVYLSRSPGGPPAVTPATADLNGKYQFANLTGGTYYLWATYNSKSSSKDLAIFIPGGRPTTFDLVMEQVYLGNLPVILVPGIMGSTTKGFHIGPYPRLKKDEGKLDTLQIHDPLGLPGWWYLRKILDYRSVTYVDCPWDWRVPVQDGGEKFLRKAIDDAKKLTGKAKVNVIAHSMGGLIVRSYIQSFPEPDNLDIDKFIMVGTPHQGSANAYYIWEGGDPKKVDDIVSDGWKGHILNFYSATTLLLMNDLSWAPLWELFNVRAFIQKHVPTVRQLLPTYKFLDNKGTLLTIENPKNKNTFLINLNKDPNRFRMAPFGTSTDPKKVKTRVYYSGDQPTIGHIEVRANADAFWSLFSSLYEDGRPYKDPTLDPIGDGTVPAHSAKLPFTQKWADVKGAKGKHATLIYECADDIATDLYGSAPPSPKTAAATMGVANNFSLSFTGRIQPYLMDPQGRKAGINAAGQIENTIPGAKIVIGAGAGSIAIDNPVNGIYTVCLRGIYQEDYRLSLSYLDSAKAVMKNFLGFNHADQTAFTVNVNSDSTAKIVINHPPAAPTGTRAHAVDVSGLKTRVRWTASADPQVISYNIYAKQIDEPFFAQIGTTTEALFDTGHPWAENDTIKPRVYAVSALRGNGMESFLSSVALNNDRDHDGLSDADEIRFGTDIANPDTDGEGLKDGEEYRYGTNPLKVDTDGDGYSDLQEIEAGSDPLDPGSTP